MVTRETCDPCSSCSSPPWQPGIGILSLQQMREDEQNWRSTNDKLRQVCWIRDLIPLTRLKREMEAGKYDAAEGSGRCQPRKNLGFFLDGATSF